MRKVVVYELMSLDGVSEDPDVFLSDWDDAMDAHLAAVIANQDTIILDGGVTRSGRSSGRRATSNRSRALLTRSRSTS